MEHVTPGSSIVGHAAVTEAVDDRCHRRGRPRPRHRGALQLAGSGAAQLSAVGDPRQARRRRVRRHQHRGAGLRTILRHVGRRATRGRHRGAHARSAIRFSRRPRSAARSRRRRSTSERPASTPVAGAGRVDALAAVRATTPPSARRTPTAPTPIPARPNAATRGRCVATPAACDDGNPCNGIEMCDPATGGCLTGTVVPDGTSCPDDSVCNGDEVCTAGICGAGDPLVCDDGDGCTADACDPAMGCRFVSLTGIEAVELRPGARPAGVSWRHAAARNRAPLRSARKRSWRAARAATRTAKQRRLVVRAAQALRRAVALARSSRMLPAECADTVAAALGDAQSRARTAARALR